MNISEVNKKYKNKWVLAEVLKENKLNQPIDVTPIMASKNRYDLYDKLATLPKDKSKTFATIFTGKITGAYLFNVNSKA